MNVERHQCSICRLQGAGSIAHWAWHQFAQCELNPVALFQWVESLPASETRNLMLGHIVATAGLNVKKMIQALRVEESERDEVAHG